MSGGEISAVGACPGLRVAAVRVAMTLAALAMRKVPKARLALTAGPAIGVGTALATAGFDVAEIIEGANAIAIARDASLWAESVGSRCATVATSANHVWLAWAHPAVVFAQKATRARWVTFAS